MPSDKVQALRRMSGMSLIEVLLAVGIAAVVTAGIVTMATNAIRTSKGTDLQLELEGIRRYLIEAISCEETLRPNSVLISECNGAGSLVKVVDVSGGLLIDKPQTRFGSHMVRAKCPVISGERRLFVEHIYVNKDGLPALHPTSRQVSTWQPLFADGLSPCAASVAAKEVTVYDDLKMDPPSLLTIVAFLLGTYSGPVSACADSEWVDPLWYTETSLAYHGFARCPRGYTVVGGGTDCSMSATGDPVVDNVLGVPVPAPNSGAPFRRRAYKLHNDPLFDEIVLNESFLPERMANVWRGSCCVRVNTVPTGSVYVPLFPLPNDLKNRVYARCVRNAP